MGGVARGLEFLVNRRLIMNENDNKPHYRWPKYVLGGVVLGIVLAVVWVWLAARKVEQQRDFGTPLPNSAPVH